MALRIGVALYLTRSQFSHIHSTKALPTGATFSPCYILRCATQSCYTRKFTNKDEGSRKTRPTILGKVMMQ
jgi:hypothetical protein